MKRHRGVGIRDGVEHHFQLTQFLRKVLQPRGELQLHLLRHPLLHSKNLPSTLRIENFQYSFPFLEWVIRRPRRGDLLRLAEELIHIEIDFFVQLCSDSQSYSNHDRKFQPANRQRNNRTDSQGTISSISGVNTTCSSGGSESGQYGQTSVPQAHFSYGLNTNVQISEWGRKVDESQIGNGDTSATHHATSNLDMMSKGSMTQLDAPSGNTTQALKEKLSELQKILSEAKEKRRLKKCFSLITICSLGPNSSYEPQVDNINTVEEADAYKEYLVSAMERVQQSNVIKLLLRSYYMEANQTCQTDGKIKAKSSYGIFRSLEGICSFYLTNRTFFVIRHVIFREDAFPFANESGSNYHPIFGDTVHGSGAFTESTPILLICDEETVVLDDRGYYMHAIEKQEQEVTEQQKEIENVVPRIVTDKVDHVVEFAVPGLTKMSTINTQTPTWVRNEGSECSIIHAMMINACILRSEFVAVDVT
uniref:Uncharacterized protein n=1 Tax=Solanum lycopersicum TaxID=4081 RepID=A0A3Q7GR08_SOLLC